MDRGLHKSIACVTVSRRIHLHCRQFVYIVPRLSVRANYTSPVPD